MQIKSVGRAVNSGAPSALNRLITHASVRWSGISARCCGIPLEKQSRRVRSSSSSRRSDLARVIDLSRPAALIPAIPASREIRSETLDVDRFCCPYPGNFNKGRFRPNSSNFRGDSIRGNQTAKPSSISPD